MHNSFWAEIQKSTVDIRNDVPYLFLLKMSFLLELWFEVTFVAEFCDYVAVAVACKNLKAAENVGVGELLEHSDFWVKKFF